VFLIKSYGVGAGQMNREEVSQKKKQKSKKNRKWLKSYVAKKPRTKEKPIYFR
jgi:hypothetical protein